MNRQLEDYLNWLRALGRSRSCIEHNKRIVRLLVDYLRDRQEAQSWKEVTESQLKRFVQWTAAAPTAKGGALAQQTQARWVSCLRGFFSWLRERQYILQDPAKSIPSPKCERKEAHSLSEAEIASLIEAPAIEQSSRVWRAIAIRDRAIMELLYGTGIRIGEASKLELYDADLATEELRIREGKGGKSRIVPLTEQAKHWLEIYLREARPQLIKSHKPTTRLWVSMFGGNITKQGISVQICKYARQLKLKATPHTFRHSYATHLLRRGAKTEQIKKLLGHEWINATEVYTHVEAFDLKKIISHNNE